MDLNFLLCVIELNNCLNLGYTSTNELKYCKPMFYYNFVQYKLALESENIHCKITNFEAVRC